MADQTVGKGRASLLSNLANLPDTNPKPKFTEEQLRDMASQEDPLAGEDDHNEEIPQESQARGRGKTKTNAGKEAEEDRLIAVNFTLPKSMVDRIKALVGKDCSKYKSQSLLVRDAIENLLEQEEEIERKLAKARAKLEAEIRGKR